MLDNNGEYRYYGKSPNNYVEFNGELWRIISSSKVFSSESDTVGEQRVKIIRDESIGTHPWDNNSKNNWENATLNDTLNNRYYNQVEDGTCYLNGSQTTCDYVNGTVKGLSSDARNLIDDALWYLGGSSTYNGMYANDYYDFERGTTVYTGNPTSWTGKVGLMYPSDYAYAADLGLCTVTTSRYYNVHDAVNTANCVGTDWLHSGSIQWTLMHFSNSSSYVFNISNYGTIPYESIPPTAAYARDIYPVVYLKSDIMIIDGDGSRDDPYVISK